MAKIRTTLTIDEAVLRAVKIRAARTGQGDSEVIEGALRRDLGLDLLDRLWARGQLPDPRLPFRETLLFQRVITPDGFGEIGQQQAGIGVHRRLLSVEPRADETTAAPRVGLGHRGLRRCARPLPALLQCLRPRRVAAWRALSGRLAAHPTFRPSERREEPCPR